MGDKYYECLNCGVSDVINTPSHINEHEYKFCDKCIIEMTKDINNRHVHKMTYNYISTLKI